MPISELVFYKVTKDTDKEVGRVHITGGKLVGPASLVDLCHRYGTMDLKVLADKIRSDYLFAILRPYGLLAREGGAGSGEGEGHEFHGNQYTGGTGGPQIFDALSHGAVKEAVGRIPVAHQSLVKTVQVTMQGDASTDLGSYVARTGLVEVSATCEGEPVSARDMQGTVYHEFGHAVEASLGDTMWGERPVMDEVREEYVRAITSGAQYYAFTNVSEFFAESYRVYMQSPSWLESKFPTMYTILKEAVFSGQEYR